jgi:hypothetical protein
MVAILGLGTALAAATAFYKAYMIVTRLAEFYTGLLSKSVFATRIQLMALAIWQKIVTVAQWAWNAAMVDNPLGLIVIAIAALVVGFIELYQHSSTFRELVNGLWADLKGFGMYVYHFFTKVVVGEAKKALKWVENNWKQIALFILFPFPMIVKKALDFFGITPKIKEAVHACFAVIKNWGNMVWTFLSGLPGRVRNAGADIGNALKNGVINGVSGVANTLRRVFGSALNSIIGMWNGLEIPGFHKKISVPLGPDIDIGWGSISLPDIPSVSLARGGIVTSPTIALLGDNPGHGGEAVIPLPTKLGGGGGITLNVTVEGSVIAERDLEKKLLEVLTTYGKRNGRVRLATSTSA